MGANRLQTKLPLPQTPHLLTGWVYDHTNPEFHLTLSNIIITVKEKLVWKIPRIRKHTGRESRECSDLALQQSPILRNYQMN